MFSTIDAGSYYWINVRDPLYLNPLRKLSTKTKNLEF